MRRRLLNWNVSGLHSLEYLVSLVGHLSEERIIFDGVGQESARVYVATVGLDCRQSVLASKFNDELRRGPELRRMDHQGVHAFLYGGRSRRAERVRLTPLQRTVSLQRRSLLPLCHFRT
jgi:hypothetical protein